MFTWLVHCREACVATDRSHVTGDPHLSNYQVPPASLHSQGCDCKWQTQGWREASELHRRGYNAVCLYVILVKFLNLLTFCFFIYHLLILTPSIVFDSFETPCKEDHHAPLSMGFPRQEYWGGLPFPHPGDLPHTGIEDQLSCIGRQILYH